MYEDIITFYQMPKLHDPVLIAGFGDWSNAGNVALKSIDYLIEKKGALLIAEINPDYFYQFTQNRPVITIKKGRFYGLIIKKISFYFFHNNEGKNDIILLRAQEPDYRWSMFIQILFHLCKQWGVSLIVSLGGMYDDVLHTEAIVSGVYSFGDWKNVLVNKNIPLIDYEGPSGIHALIMEKAETERHPFIGLWGRSPLYLRGTNFRVVMRIVSLLASLFAFSVDVGELESSLKEFEDQIVGILEDNSELQEYIEKIKKIRSGKLRKKDTPKIINIKDFMRQRDS